MLDKTESLLLLLMIGSDLNKSFLAIRLYFRIAFHDTFPTHNMRLLLCYLCLK